MVKEIGRLTDKEEQELIEETKKTLELVQKDDKKGKATLEKLAGCKNYFGRLIIAETLAKSPLKEELAKNFIKKLLNSHNYAKRATALFFFYYYYDGEPEKIIDIVSKYYNDIKWEAENIMDQFWKKYPNLMKQNMLKWIESSDENKRSLSFHGLGNIAPKDPHFAMEFIEKIIDDESIEVQKKITHTIVQLARARPADVYPYLKEWLRDANEKRIKTIWVSMKKLTSSLTSNGKERNKDFEMLTKETIKDWKRDKNPKISTMGEKLYELITHEQNSQKLQTKKRKR
ncbi:MAG: HEAT repeat domain-containing protein [Candidatus Cloacimonadia bacterium]